MKVIRNTKSGHTYTLLRTAADTNGTSLEMEVAYPANSAEPPAHYHPFQSERFRVSHAISDASGQLGYFGNERLVGF